MAEKRIRSKAVTEQNFYDVFGLWSFDEQTNVLKMLNVIHDQTGRMERKLAAKAAKPAPDPKQPCTFCAAYSLDEKPVLHAENCPNYKKPAPVQESLIEDAPICVKCGAVHGPEQASCLAAPR